MTDLPPSLAQAPFLGEARVRAIFAALAQEGEETRVVGGAVRDALLGLPVKDIDFATTLAPPLVGRRAQAAGIKTVPTGAEHGTLTLVVDGRGFEVTTLRADIATDGRHAVVRFGRDWAEDARRRDFTVNAFSLDAEGRVFDPLGGYDDLLARRICFIGEPDRRIGEDRLRILRFFRFLSVFGEGAPDPASLGAAIRARQGLSQLSAERVGQEMRKLLIGRRAAEVTLLMEESGILPLILAGVARPLPFRCLIGSEKALGASASAEIRLLVLECRIVEDIQRLSERLRLSGAERRRMEAALAVASQIQPNMPLRSARRILYRNAAAAFGDGVLLAGALRDKEAHTGWEALYRLPEHSPPVRFPLTGRDALAAGMPAGPGVGALLAALEDWWVEADFQPDKSALQRKLLEWVHSKG